MYLSIELEEYVDKFEVRKYNCGLYSCMKENLGLLKVENWYIKEGSYKSIFSKAPLKITRV